MPPNATTPSHKPRAYRWFQLSVRGLLLLVLIAGVAFAWVVHKVDAIKSQDAAAKRLASLGGYFRSDRVVLNADGEIESVIKHAERSALGSASSRTATMQMSLLLRFGTEQRTKHWLIWNFCLNCGTLRSAALW